MFLTPYASFSLMTIRQGPKSIGIGTNWTTYSWHQLSDRHMITWLLNPRNSPSPLWPPNPALEPLRPSSLAPTNQSSGLPDTGNKDPYTQWAHGEYIVGTDNTWLQCTQWLKFGYILNILCNGSIMHLMVKNWAHSECLLPLWPKCAHWLQITPILNDCPNVTTICNPITGWSHFECTQHWIHLALLAEHVDSIQNILPEVSQMCLVIIFRMYLKCNPFSGLHSECCCTSQCV